MREEQRVIAHSGNRVRFRAGYHPDRDTNAVWGVAQMETSGQHLPFSGSLGSASKERRAHPDDGGAFFDGYVKVLTHTHR